MAEIYVGSAHAQIVDQGDSVLVHSLEGNGNPGDLLALLRNVKRIGKQVYVSVDFENPRMKQLIRVYSMMGAKPVSVVLEVANGL